ncbi:MAG: nickel-dependent hydrogenase large subunit [Rhodospirillaceae bacterium]|jgi:hydrogenase large subunit|nr:nickel-dependent hydrogenase large subunit [Rhodospirillaceae bacterium]MBT7769785.1 nickel-dependent hydrogenase large subunit [Rhodospirillales bacterium]MBT4699678.1 nickel-dependent hydrogenase large subunit [Rhodospirillaceae bacterium]MBT5034433.1 nickel-dependent hydrogenase large subunit [Rhodospirillaceae bacterium]MBT6218399.1 nickel-dependent hydrogenase large subunit [Rhodospirillaceae bacterium]
MCFENLPIDFDENGNAFLKPGIKAPFAYDVGETQDREERLKEIARKNGQISDIDYDPVTRVAGALAFHSTVNLQERKVLDTNSMATLFRGYEVILRGRDPRDAAFISSRACGVCGGVHATASALSIEMALGIKPPPLGIVVRNLLLSCEYLYDNPLHLFVLSGPDYSESLVKDTNPEIWEKAVSAKTKFSDVHGYATIAEIMTDLNPLSGKLYLEALTMTRVAREAYVLLGGKYPHPETVIPGGVTTMITLTTLNEFYIKLHRFFDYSKKCVGIWDDIYDFFYECDPDYRDCGRLPATMVDFGQWDHEDYYDATYENCNAWGEKRWSTPGAVVDGKLVTTRLQDLNVGLEEFIEHSYYEDWNDYPFKTDPLGAPLSPNHPWNKTTIPKPGAQDWKERYSWSTTPTWDRKVFEAGAYARVYISALAQKLPESDYIKSTGKSLILNVGKGPDLPAKTLEWKVPDVWNTFERNRARAYAVAFNAMVTLENWTRALDLMKRGETKVSTPFEIPTKGRFIGAGFWGAGRGFLCHHCVIEDGVLANYQIVTPSTVNACPRTPWGEPGAYEQAVLNSPILEADIDNTDAFKGIDILRTLRSFDPCMPCTTHVMVEGTDHVVSREVTTCACGIDA